MAGSDNNSAVGDERAQRPQAGRPSEEVESVAARPEDAHLFEKHILLANTNIAVIFVHTTSNINDISKQTTC